MLNWTKSEMCKKRLSGDESSETWPTYDCRVGRHQQLRCQVPLSSLRPWPCPGEMVLAWISGSWMPARFGTSYGYIGVGQVVLEDPTSNQASSLQVPLHFIRRRFFKGQHCHVYRGRDIGWADGTIEEDMCVENLYFTRLFFIIFTCPYYVLVWPSFQTKFISKTTWSPLRCLKEIRNES